MNSTTSLHRYQDASVQFYSHLSTGTSCIHIQSAMLRIVNLKLMCTGPTSESIHISKTLKAWKLYWSPEMYFTCLKCGFTCLRTVTMIIQSVLVIGSIFAELTLY